MKWNNNGETIIETEAEHRQVFLDWVNNFISASSFAEHYGWSEEHACQVIDEGRELHEAHVVSLKNTGSKDA